MNASSLLRRLLLEQLLRKRLSSDYERYVESFRRCAVDPNPHQLEAVAFALRRLPEGGAMLCDEVGLGKTIEAGLVLTQLRAERRGHILIVVPLPLARQWQVELKDLFGLNARHLNKETLGDTPGIYIVGREFAGSPAWAPEIARRGPWDLVVVDEAHEGLSSIHHRFSKMGGGYQTNPKKGKARRAAYLKEIIGDAPVLLLTATPIQNTVYELWSLVHFVDPRNTILGSFHEFTRLFAVNNGRNVREEAQHDLRERLRLVICRTLRADAQPFLKTPFTKRRCETINFHMQALERTLYDDVSEWLQDRISIYEPNQRKLVITTLRRRMGSSVNALARTLTLMRERLENGEIATKATPHQVERDIAELRRLEELASRALAGPAPKLEKLTEFIGRLDAREVEGVSSDKLVIFTESVRTLQTLVAHLEGLGLEGQVTSFSGQNDTPAAAAALARWEEEVGRFVDPAQRPDRSSAVRAALVHEFRTRTRILVATEAGAKGLNLQFCNCLLNYDLPWNPQRIEQRIGRVHRYGQKHDVVIVNFINLDNEGEQRVYKLLNEKLRLFEGLLGASDAVLGDVSSVLDFESRVVDLLSQFRTEEERRREFARLEREIDEATRKQREARKNNAHQVLSELDPDVQARLTQAAAEIPAALSQRDQTLLRILSLEAPVTPVVQDVFEWKGRRVHVGPPRPGPDFGEPLTLEWVGGERSDSVDSYFCEGALEAVWEVHRVTVVGLETEEHVVVLGPPGLEEILDSGAGLQPGPAWQPSPELENACREIQSQADAQQAPYLQRLLRLCAARRADLRRSLDKEEAELREAVQKTLKGRVVARTPQQSGFALVEHRKAEGKLESFLASREERWRDTLAQLEDNERSIQARRYVETHSVPLFRLECRKA